MRKKALKKRLRPLYDVADEIEKEDYVDRCDIGECEELDEEDDICAEGKMNLRVIPERGGVTNTLRGRLKGLVSEVPGLYLKSFDSPRQKHKGPHYKQDLQEFYKRHPYIAEFRFSGQDERDGVGVGEHGLEKEGSLMSKQAKRVASKFFLRKADYKPKDTEDVEEMIGYLFTRQFGDEKSLSEEHFDKVKEDALQDLPVDSVDQIDLDDDSHIDALSEAVVDVADEEGLIEEE